MVFRRCLTWRVVAIFAAPLLLAATPPVAEQSETGGGRGIYLRECASCHGQSASGYGPAWSVLRQPPPDLTDLSDSTRPFNAGRIRNIVTGHMRRVPPQWPSEMPYWREASSEDLDALMTYLESVQRRPYGTPRGVTIAQQAGLGEPLFRSFCASCHGDDGRGPKTGALVLGVAVPDLTLFASHNQGTVDMRRLYEAIARHRNEDSAMPGWTQAFEQMGWTGYINTLQIEDIAWYIESIQRR